jgi:hypothetical protein
MANFVAGSSMCNSTVSEANQLINLFASLGADGAQLFACPSAQAGTVAQLVPYVDFGKENVPTKTPAYLMLQFPGNAKYPDSYTVGMCWYMISEQKIAPLATLA